MFMQSPVVNSTGARASLSEVRHRLDDSFGEAIKVDGEDEFGEFGAMGRGWWQGGLSPSFTQSGYATPELARRMQIYGAHDRCGFLSRPQNHDWR